MKKVTVDLNVLLDFLNKREVNDFEDAVVEVSSMKKKVDYIITRDMSDFASSRVKAVTPSQFLQLLQEEF